MSLISCLILQAPPAKKTKKTEETDGGAFSKGKGGGNKGKGDAGKSGKTDWDSIKWNELGETKDARY